eukprot:3759231-Rhodomonas_salina.3
MQQGGSGHRPLDHPPLLNKTIQSDSRTKEDGVPRSQHRAVLLLGTQHLLCIGDASNCAQKVYCCPNVPVQTCKTVPPPKVQHRVQFLEGGRNA